MIFAQRGSRLSITYYVIETFTLSSENTRANTVISFSPILLSIKDIRLRILQNKIKVRIDETTGAGYKVQQVQGYKVSLFSGSESGCL